MLNHDCIISTDTGGNYLGLCRSALSSDTAEYGTMASKQALGSPWIVISTSPMIPLQLDAGQFDVEFGSSRHLKSQ